MGIILFNLVSGDMPFKGYVTEEHFDVLFKKPEYSHPAWDECSSGVKDLVATLLTRTPMQRLDVQEILNHKWFNQPTKRQKYRFSYEPYITRDLLL